MAGDGRGASRKAAKQAVTFSDTGGEMLAFERWRKNTAKFPQLKADVTKKKFHADKVCERA